MRPCCVRRRRTGKQVIGVLCPAELPGAPSALPGPGAGGLPRPASAHLSLPSLQNMASGRCALTADATTCARERPGVDQMLHAQAQALMHSHTLHRRVQSGHVQKLPAALGQTLPHCCRRTSAARPASAPWRAWEHACSAEAVGARPPRRPGGGGGGAGGPLRLHGGADLRPERVQDRFVHAQQPLPVGLPARRAAAQRPGRANTGYMPRSPSRLASLRIVGLGIQLSVRFRADTGARRPRRPPTASGQRRAAAGRRSCRPTRGWARARHKSTAAQAATQTA